MIKLVMCLRWHPEMIRELFQDYWVNQHGPVFQKNAATGVDKITWWQYEANLKGNIDSLVERLKNKRYRAKLGRRRYIPKSPGKQRPLGIPALEDKLVQRATRSILEAIYEEDFRECNIGYRPGRGAQQLVRSHGRERHGKGRVDPVRQETERRTQVNH